MDYVLALGENPDFPIWLRASHLINLVLIGMLLRSGIEMLSSLPRLWWRSDCAPGTEWIKFTKRELPKEEGVYTSLMDELSVSPMPFPARPREHRIGPPLARRRGDAVGAQWLCLRYPALCHRPVAPADSDLLGYSP